MSFSGKPMASIPRRDATKSTPEGEWEMRDGKWYRKDYYAAEVVAPPPPPPVVVEQPCPQCPIYLERIRVLLTEIEKLKLMLAERDNLIMQMRARLEKWELDYQAWLSERRSLEVRIQQLEALIKEKEALILQLQEKLRLLIQEVEFNRAKIVKMQEIINTYEKQVVICRQRGFRCNLPEVPVADLAPAAPIVQTRVVYEPVQSQTVVTTLPATTCGCNCACHASAITGTVCGAGGICGAGGVCGGRSSAAMLADAADGRIDGKFFGANIQSSGAPLTGLARAIDMADGRLDGAYNGTPIVQTGGPAGVRTVGMGMGMGGFSSSSSMGIGSMRMGTSGMSAAQLADAADGRMDGKFFGSNIQSQGLPLSGLARAIDAADGKIDGKLNGVPIVQTGGPPSVTYVR